MDRPLTPWIKDIDPWSLSYIPKNPWGERSKENITTLDPRLRYLCNMLADVMNVTLLYGHRYKELQDELHRENPIGALPWPKSLHNRIPSLAVDMAPYPIDWEDLSRFDMMIGASYAIASAAGFGIRSGKFFSNVTDYPHIEIVE